MIFFDYFISKELSCIIQMPSGTQKRLVQLPSSSVELPETAQILSKFLFPLLLAMLQE